MLFEGVDANLAVASAEGKSREGIIIPLRNRIELVVVTTGTADSETEEGFRQDIDPVIDSIRFIFANIDRGMDFFAQEPKPGSQ